MPDIDVVHTEYVPASGAHQNKCTVAQVDELFSACEPPSGTTTACNDFYKSAKEHRLLALVRLDHFIRL